MLYNQVIKTHNRRYGRKTFPRHRTPKESIRPKPSISPQPSLYYIDKQQLRSEKLLGKRRGIIHNEDNIYDLLHKDRVSKSLDYNRYKRSNDLPQYSEMFVSDNRLLLYDNGKRMRNRNNLKYLHNPRNKPELKYNAMEKLGVVRDNPRYKEEMKRIYCKKKYNFVEKGPYEVVLKRNRELTRSQLYEKKKRYADILRHQMKVNREKREIEKRRRFDY